MTKASSPPPAPSLSLPNELVGSICHLLPNSTIKNLRLTCRFFADKAQLRLRRVFISPNLDNFGALRGIADHDTFRRGIEEIIWDDATLKPIQRDERWNSCGWDPDAEDSDEEEEPVSQWFVRLCKTSIAHLKQRMAYQNRPDTVARQEELDNAMSFQESLKHYRVLMQRQQDILQIRADEDASRYTLQRFPRLKRQGNYWGLLSDIRDKLGWRNRPVDARVKICVLITFNQHNRAGRYIRLDKEVQDYIYGSGPPPFGPSGYISCGTGVQEDELNPHWKRPYEDARVLRSLGY
ncbi:hypothetical protein NCS56_01198000 [Fusarium sp. Ph1]|nr:hypothetical protein NCS56_01198000 [Fusarium sp. Ph1]